MIENLIIERDRFEINSEEWLKRNRQKADYLESIKPSTKERIIAFKESDLKEIPEGFTSTNQLPNIPYFIERRSILEYNPIQRHPIPYCLVRYQDQFFFILRESGSGELRLIGKKGLLGGHIGEEDVNSESLVETIFNGLKRELAEEAGITSEMIVKTEIKGLIKSNDGVDSDHLGIVYEVELNTNQIQSEEEGVLKGIWIDKNDLLQHVDSFESWARIVYNEVLQKTLIVS